jgi:hypothetical protein
LAGGLAGDIGRCADSSEAFALFNAAARDVGASALATANGADDLISVWHPTNNMSAAIAATCRQIF